MRYVQFATFSQERLFPYSTYEKKLVAIWIIDILFDSLTEIHIWCTHCLADSLGQTDCLSNIDCMGLNPMHGFQPHPWDSYCAGALSKCFSLSCSAPFSRAWSLLVLNKCAIIIINWLNDWGTTGNCSGHSGYLVFLNYSPRKIIPMQIPTNINFGTWWIWRL